MKYEGQMREITSKPCKQFKSTFFKAKFGQAVINVRGENVAFYVVSDHIQLYKSKKYILINLYYFLY